MKIPVLFLIDSLQVFGGAEKNLFTVSSGLNPDKYRAIVCCLKDGDGAEVFRDKGINIINLGLRRIYNFDAIKKAIQLISIIRKEKVKVMVTYLESSDFFGSIVGKISGVSVLISNRRDMGFNLKRRHIIAYKIINRFFTRIITVCEAVKEIIVKRENVHPDKIITIYNGVQLPELPNVNKLELKKSLGLDANKQAVTMLANFEPIKGHKDFLLVANEVLKKYDSVQFLLVGTGEDGYKQELQNFVDKLGIKNNVIFAGFRTDIPKVLSISDISVLSSNTEGFSNTILESFAVGKPMVTTAVGGNPEIVRDGINGFLVPPRNSDALTEAILKLLRNKELATKMGARGREDVMNFFTTEMMLEDIENLYEILVVERKYTSGRFRKIRLKLFKLCKLLLANILYYLRIISLYETMKSKNKVKILAYHKISNALPYLYLNTKVISFRKQMEYLKGQYKIISLREAVELLKTASKFPGKSVVVTFDDGNKSLFNNVFPILQDLKIPATVFLTVNPIEKKEPVWFEFIVYAINKTLRKTLNLESYGLKKYLINTLLEKTEVIEQVVKHVKILDNQKKKEFLAVLSDKLKIKADNLDLQNLDIISWEEIRKMQERGIYFGAHTLTHPVLTRLPAEEVASEVFESKKIIEDRLGEKISYFAYPNGKKSDFNEQIINLLKNGGFDCACTLMDGSNNTDLFALRRINIFEELSADLFGAFSKPLFAAEISGIFDYFRKVL